MSQITKKIMRIGGLSLIAMMSNYAFASGYKLEFQSVSTLADGGDAAVVEDAGTNWYNSAGLVMLPQQLVYSVIDLYEQTTFKGSSVAPNALGNTFIGIGKASSYTNVGLPAFHYSLPLYDRFAFGFSFAPSWGLLENYGPNAFTRYDLQRVYTKTMEFEPSLAIKINNQWSLGAGPDISYFELIDQNHARTQGITVQDSISHVSAQNWGYGGHIGLLYRMTEATRFGFNYRSQIAHHLKGTSDFVLTGLDHFKSRHFKLNLPHPPTATVSVYHDVTPCWALMGTITFDQWSYIHHLRGVNYIQPPTALDPSGLLVITIPQHLRNTLDFSAGTKFQWTDKILFRTSVKYEQTPTRNRYRDINFPDGEKLGFNFGMHYQWSKHIGLDMIYAHVFTRTVPIHLTAPITSVTTKGHSDTTIDMAGAQLVWTV